MTKALFVTNFCPHYHVRLFELLALQLDLKFLFTSQGSEWYWDRRHGVKSGDFRHEYLPGLQLGPRLRITPALVHRILTADSSLIFCALAGRFALPVTYLLARARGIPFILWTGLWRHPETIFHRLSYPLLRYIYRNSAAIVVYGRHVRDYLVGLGVEPKRIFIANHATDNELYNRAVGPTELDGLRAKHGLFGRAVILYVGRLTPIKGLQQLIQAVTGLADLKPVLILVGEGPLASVLQHQSADSGVEIRFVGYVPTDQLYQFYALADVFVLPSVTIREGRELWGLVINEAMNQAVPIVATEAVGAVAGGLVRDRETGLVVSEADVPGLSAALRRLLEDREFAERIGRGGQREVAHWGIQQMATGFIAAAQHAIRTSQPAGQR